ncbi:MULTISPECIES: DUF6907 domain-containing protein [unclassified Streptomyces]|uniref:DUF6907 domain-containing protein n=1 Tax=unclassified Streptomyces TaxID=2593676 RepID=UPI002E2D9B50|nr:hypothetical protein [Streptomyces sp. NBC_00223]
MSIISTAASLCTSDQTRTWKITTANGIAACGYLPDWAEADPSESGVDPERLHVTLADIAHRMAFRGMTLTVFTRDGGAEHPHEVDLLHGEIECHPYSDPDHPNDPRIPVANVQISPDCWMAGLEPGALAELAAKLRTHADCLEHTLLPALVAAREDQGLCKFPGSSNPSEVGAGWGG